MARPRKTIDVTDLRIKVNDMLEHSRCSKDVRRGMQTVLEHVLHETGNYKGFRYLDESEVPSGELPGIIRGTTTKMGLSDVVVDNQFPDETRVQYYG